MFYCKPYVSVQGYCTVITENGRVTKSKISYIFNNIFWPLKISSVERLTRISVLEARQNSLMSHLLGPFAKRREPLLSASTCLAPGPPPPVGGETVPQKKPVFTAVLVIIKLNVLDLGTSCARTEDLLGGRTHAQSEENLKCLYEQRVKSPISQDPRQQNQHIRFLSHSLMRVSYRD